MKRLVVFAVLCMSFILGANAQYRGIYGNQIYDGPGYQRVFPSRRFGSYINRWNRPYVGFRVGLTLSSVTDYDGSGIKSGLNVGLATGFPIFGQFPLHLESGLYYTEKGSKDRYTSTKLNYLELPLVLKYKARLNGICSVEPYFGGYAALGIAGKIKHFDEQKAHSSFDDFRRGDVGLKLGCGLGLGIFYVDLNYDWGLANINKDAFHESHNGSLILNAGMNF